MSGGSRTRKATSYTVRGECAARPAARIGHALGARQWAVMVFTADPTSADVVILDFEDAVLAEVNDEVRRGIARTVETCYEPLVLRVVASARHGSIATLMN